MADPFDTAETDRLLSTTRSVRKRLDLDRPVDPVVVRDCIEIALQAPNGGNSQDWGFMVVTDADKRAEVARLYREAGLDGLTRTAATAEDAQTRRVYESALYLTQVLHRVPVHVIPCVRRHGEFAHNALVAGMYASIIPAAWSLMLALRSRGLGAAWTTIHLRREREVAALLGIPDSMTQVALLPVAYSVGTDFKPARRTPVDEVTFWNAWGETNRPLSAG
jgi:nitroreductase